MVEKNLYPNFDFMGKRFIAIAFSGLLMLGSLVSLTVNGLNPGLDFTGGTLMELSFKRTVDLDEIRGVLSRGGVEQVVAQYFGSSREVLIRLPPKGQIEITDNGEDIIQLLREASFNPELNRIENVGPQVGAELVETGWLTILYAMLGILVYVAMRFQFRFAVGAIAALIHDVIITFGFFSVTRMEFDLTILAAILAIIGYSLNDTIVVFDRIREIFRRARGLGPLQVMNTAINQTLRRTIMMSAVTLLSVLAMFFFAGATLKGFSAALIVGIVVGTYSSIYIAAPITLWLGISYKDLMPVEKEGANAT